MIRHILISAALLTTLGLMLRGSARAEQFYLYAKNESGASAVIYTPLGSPGSSGYGSCGSYPVPNGGDDLICFFNLSCSDSCSSVTEDVTYRSQQDGDFARAIVTLPAYGDPYLAQTYGDVTLDAQDETVTGTLQ